MVVEGLGENRTVIKAVLVVAERTEKGEETYLKDLKKAGIGVGAPLEKGMVVLRELKVMKDVKEKQYRRFEISERGLKLAKMLEEIDRFLESP